MAGNTKTAADEKYDSILGDISDVIDEARRSATRSVNSIMTAAYWLIGRQVVESEQEGAERAAYGQELMARLSQDLTSRYGRGFRKSNLFLMRAFYLEYAKIFQTPSGKSAKPSCKSNLADAGQMHLYLNYARKRWTRDGENPPVGLILCAHKNDAVARYALEGLPNKIMAAEYRTALPDEKKLAAEIKRTRTLLQDRIG